MAQRILSLELTEDRIQAAVAERAWSSFALLGTYQSERAEDETDLGPALRRLISQTGHPDIVLSAIPGELVAKRLLTLPFSDRRRLAQAVPFALEEHLPFSVEEAVVAFLPLMREGKSSLVLAALARRTDLQAHLDLLAEAGLDPKTVTLGSLALGLLIKRTHNGNGAGASHLLLDLERRRTSVILIDDGGIPRALRILPVGVDPGLEGADVDTSADAIVAAVRQTMLSKAVDPGPADLIVSGPAASSVAVRERFARDLALPIHAMDELDCTALLGNPTPEWMRQASCVAMLLSEMPVQPVPLINFRTGEFAFQGRTGDLAPLYASAILGGVLALMGIIHLILGGAVYRHHLNLLNREIVAVAAPVVANVPGEQVKRVLTSRLVAARKRLRLLGGSTGPASPLDTLLAISQALPDRISLDIDELDIDDTGLKITAKADSYGTIDEVKRALSHARGLSEVKVSEEGPAEGHKVLFHLSAEITDTGVDGEQ